MNDAAHQLNKTRYLPIGQFAKTSQLSRKALRIYAEQGLLEPAYVDSRSGYRYYSPDQLERARFIRMLRGMEMPIADIRRVLAATTAAEALELVSATTQDFESRVAGVRRASERVIAYLHKEPEKVMVEISAQSFPVQRVATLKKHLHVGPFQQFIPQALEQISTYIRAAGAQISGDPVCFFYGPVNESDAGPVEIGFPVSGELEPQGEIRVREIPAHRAALGTFPPDQSRYPEIIDAWDAVVAWVQENQLRLSDEPVCCYEIWHENETTSIVQPFENSHRT